MFMFETGSTEHREYMESVYRTILEKDVLKRNSAASKQLVENLLSYLVYNIGCLTSTKRITDTLNSNGTKVSYNTVDSYFETLQDCYFVYKADRYDVVGKEYLKLINKYYVTDFGFKYYILNNKTVELSQILENLVFLELKRRRFKVATGKVADKEVDFIIKDNQIRTSCRNRNGRSEITAGITSFSSNQRLLSKIRYYARRYFCEKS